MTADVRDQLQELCAFMDDLQGTLTADDVVDRVDERAGTDAEAASMSEPVVVDAVLDLRPVTASSRPRQPRWSAVAGAMAAAVVLILGGLVVLTPEQDRVETDTLAASSPEREPEPSVTDSTRPSDAVNLGLPVWPQIPVDPEVFGPARSSSISTIVAGGPGFVAVGSRDGDAAVWTSTDGLDWTRVPHDDAVFGGDGARAMSDVVVGGPGLVAVGSESIPGSVDEDLFADDERAERDDALAGGDKTAAVWTSVDGLSWSRVPHDDLVFGGATRHEMSSVTAGGPGLVAVGTSGDVVDEPGRLPWDGDAAVWTSVDGLTWSRVAHDEAVFGGSGLQAMTDVVAGGPGVVAVGYDGTTPSWDNSPDQDAAVWTSVDGLTWLRVAHDEVVFGAQKPVMLSVTVGGPGLVAVGWSSPHGAPAAVWTSVDGREWSRIDHENRAEMGGTMVAVTSGGPGLIAVGSGGAEAAIWTSVDGAIWARSGVTAAGDGSWLWAVLETDERTLATASPFDVPAVFTAPGR